MASVSREDYLKAIFMLAEQNAGPVNMGALAQRVGVSPASATGMVKTLDKLGLVEHRPYVGVSLTGQGKRIALHVLRRHRLIEQFLVQTLGMDWSRVDREADAIEHVISDDLVERIDDFLGRPSFDPHGDPIPDAQGRRTARQLITLADASLGVDLVVAQVTDQESEFLQFVHEHDLVPGRTVKVASHDDAAGTVVISGPDGEDLTLSLLVARKIKVQQLDQ